MAEAEIISMLSKSGLVDNLTSPAALTGKSGVRHTFSFSLGDRKKPDIVCDVIVGKVELDETRVLSLFIKVFDVGPNQAILCVSPGLTQAAARLAMMYNILTLESADAGKLPQMLEGVLRRLEDGGQGKPPARPQDR